VVNSFCTQNISGNMDKVDILHVKTRDFIGTIPVHYLLGAS
jgi:hypothetical protein